MSDDAPEYIDIGRNATTPNGIQVRYVRADLYEAVMKDRAETYACLIACTDQRDDLKRQVSKYREALQHIANEDYRGNRPHSATIAFEALKG